MTEHYLTHTADSMEKRAWAVSPRRAAHLTCTALVVLLVVAVVWSAAAELLVFLLADLRSFGPRLS